MKKKIFEIVKNALLDLNEELEYDSLKNITEDTPVFGGVDSIDSLSLVRLVVVLESEISEAFDKTIALADEKVMSQKSTPFKTAGVIVNFIQSKLEES